MARAHDSKSHGMETYTTTATAENNDWEGTIEQDLERELALRPSSSVPAKPARMALSAIRDTLDRRTREWRGSARVVEQSLRQLIAAEQTRAEALQALARAEADVARTGQALSDALAAFDETDDLGNIDPLFGRSEAALDELDRATDEVSVAQHWCRLAWKAYAEALATEQRLRLHIQSSDWAA